jgi:hypothetical protein
MLAVVARSRAARRLVAAGAAAAAILLLTVVLIVATLMGGLAPQSQCGRGSYAPSAAALADIPGNYLHWIQGAGARYGLDWTVIAGIYSVETDFGRSNLPGVRSGENSAGAGGPGQFLSGTWHNYGIDGDGDGVRDRYDPADAIPGTANLLRHNGAPADYRRAVFAYNHAGWYVEDVLADAARYRGAADAQPAAAQLVAATDTSEASCSAATVPAGPAALDTAVRLTFPTAYRTLPAWTMVVGRPPEPVDSRIYNDVVWVLRRYGLRVMAAREPGHHTHGDGTAVDLVPASGASQRDWDATAGRLAHDLGWTPACGASGARPACPLKPAIQWIGYDGYPSHGSPRTCTGGCPAHIHVSWVSGCYGSSALVAPCAWVMAFPVPSDGGANPEGRAQANTSAAVPQAPRTPEPRTNRRSPHDRAYDDRAAVRQRI